MRLPPGSWMWLLAHDMRLAGREFRAASRRRRVALRTVFIATLVLLHLAGYFGAGVLAEVHDGSRATALLSFTFILAVAFAVFLSKAISESAEALFQRGDLDLLMSSPLPMRRVLATRLLAIAITAGFTPMLLALPLVNGMMLAGEFAWAGLYPALTGLALLSSACGAALTFGLLAWLGPRWTKIAARALATLFGALTFLAIQAKVVLGEETRAAIWQAMEPGPGAWGPLWWPAKAALGNGSAMLGIFVAALAAMTAVSTGLGRAYARGVMGTLALPRAVRAGGVERRFGGSLRRVLLVKEWRLMLRHPGLGAQVFYQAVFLIPGTIAMTHIGGTGAQSPAGVVFLTAMMTGRITKILLAAPFEADQAAGLVASSPAGAAQVMQAKLAVSWAAIAVVGGLPALAIGLRLPAALPALAIACPAAAATRLLLARRRPQKLWRPGLQGRLHGSTDGLLGVAIDVGWGLFGALLTVFI